MSDEMRSFLERCKFRSKSLRYLLSLAECLVEAAAFQLLWIPVYPVCVCVCLCVCRFRIFFSSALLSCYKACTESM